jgi:hypothetical protein
MRLLHGPIIRLLLVCLLTSLATIRTTSPAVIVRSTCTYNNFPSDRCRLNSSARSSHVFSSSTVSNRWGRLGGSAETLGRCLPGARTGAGGGRGKTGSGWYLPPKRARISLTRALLFHSEWWRRERDSFCPYFNPGPF